MTRPTAPDPAALHAALREAARHDSEGRVLEAVTAYVTILRRVPQLPATWYNLARLYRRARQYDAALAAYDQALAHRIERPEEVRLNRAVIYADCLNRAEDAERELRDALALNPAYVAAMMNLANLHEDLGRRDEALRLYEKILALEPHHAAALARLAVASTGAAIEPAAARLEQAIARPGIQASDRATLGFALGNVLDRAGAYEGAFAAYAAANQAQREDPVTLRYDRALMERAADEVIATFDGTTPRAPTATGEVRPIFICGMFRSGSTLAERVLGGHARVETGGELDFIPTLARSKLVPFPQAIRGLTPAQLETFAGYYLEALAKLHPGDAHVTDKRLDNFALIGFIKSLFPGARIVHTTRDPLDNCLSAFFLHAGDTAYAQDLMDIGHYYVQYRRLMAHWRKLYGEDILDFSYETFVREPEPALRALLQHCRLPWQDGLLDAFHRRPGVVKTASLWQVRRPLYGDSVGRWRHYAAQLEPLRAYLAESGVV